MPYFSLMDFTNDGLPQCIFRSMVTVVFNSSVDDLTGTGFYIKYSAVQGN